MIEYNGVTLEIETQLIDVKAMTEPDPRWRYTDAEGHSHEPQAASEGHLLYPTLRQETGPADWCEDCGDEHTDAWFVCRQCGERVTPGTRTGTSKMIRGFTSYTLDGVRVSEADAREFIAEYQRELDQRAGGTP